MTTNERKLEKWYKSISHFEKLKFPETKELIAELEKEQNPESKKEIRERIILGTLHIIYSFIKSNDIYLLPNANYDMDDVIQVYIETWINFIDSGSFEKVYSYSQVFHSLYIRTSELLVGKKESFYDKSKINFELFDLILNYAMNNIASYAEFSDFVKQNLKSNISDSEIQELYTVINDILKYIFDVLGDEALSLTTRKHLRNLLCSFRDKTSGNSIPANPDLEEQVTNEIYYEQVFASLDAIPKALISKKDFERMKRILHYKIDDNLNFREIGEKFGLTGDRIGQIYKKASACLRRAARVIS